MGRADQATARIGYSPHSLLTIPVQEPGLDQGFHLVGSSGTLAVGSNIAPDLYNGTGTATVV